MVALLAYVSYKILKPFLIALTVGAIISFIVRPVYKLANRVIKSKVLCSFILTTLLLVLVAIPVFLLFNVLTKESFNIYNAARDYVKEKDLSNDLFNCTNSTEGICFFVKPIEENINTELGNQISKTVAAGAQKIVSFSASFVAGVPGAILQVIVLIITVFIVFIEGENLSSVMYDMIPLSDEHRTKLFHDFKNITNGVIYGQVLSAIVQGVVAGIGFYFFGVGSPITWGLFTCFFSFIPFAGAISIWLPIATVKLVSALISKDVTGTGLAIGLIVYGTLVISSIDNFIKPKFIGDKSKLNPLIALVSIFGGIALFGIAGIFLGPIIIALFFTIINIYISEVKTKTRPIKKTLKKV